MQWFTVLITIGIVAVSAVGSDGQELPVKSPVENLSHIPRPLEHDANKPNIATASNKLSTNGYLVFSGQFPYHAELYVDNGVITANTHTCGSLITPNYILTRGNTLQASKLHGVAVLGVDDGSDPTTQQSINFTEGDIRLLPMHDLATVRLEHPVIITKFVQPIRLPRLSDDRWYEMMEGTTVGGYTTTSRCIRNQIMSNDDCQKQHPQVDISSYHICTNTYFGGAFCNRAYGSGLIVEGEKERMLVGITILASLCNVNYPIVYLRVSEFRDLIAMNSDYVFDA
ncbi:plasma kallikrein-like [Anopheles moucheti]|uniref:plasma kallikrein-like n=1 Tax=Anopheles moucheti TaxID=186751 RepID=UPI0022F0520E|nr:plasma kallikrein-like [Anopheles moucheti]